MGRIWDWGRDRRNGERRVPEVVLVRGMPSPQLTHTMAFPRGTREE